MVKQQLFYSLSEEYGYEVEIYSSYKYSFDPFSNNLEETKYFVELHKYDDQFCVSFTLEDALRYTVVHTDIEELFDGLHDAFTGEQQQCELCNSNQTNKIIQSTSGDPIQYICKQCVTDIISVLSEEVTSEKVVALTV